MHSKTILTLFALLPLAAQSLPPEPPSIMREATGVIRNTTVTPATNTFTRPHIPGLRVTADGRVGIVVEGYSTPAFTLMVPEKLTQPFLNNPAGSYTLSRSGWKYLDTGSNSNQYTLPNTLDGVHRGTSHACMWETAPPTTVAGEDVYTIKVFASTNWTTTVAPIGPRTQFFVTPIKVYVSNPKTVNAAIRSIVKDGATVAGPALNFNANMFEPLIAGDGRLLVGRVGSSSMPWNDTNTGAARTAQGCDIFYCYYPTGNIMDPTQWTNLCPISHAPFDARINTKFGFAMAQFRDPEGTLIPDGEDIGGTYPWMDREAKNLFMEIGGDQLHYVDPATGLWTKSRYPIAEVPEQPVASWAKPEAGGKHELVAFCGLWSHGKVVVIDNMINDTDYAVGAGDNADPLLGGPEQRFVQLYQADAARSLDGWLRMGYGRSTKFMPPGENDNGNIIDSIENLMNYRQYIKPISKRDVSWLISVGKQTDELEFDDYIDPDAFIVANMAGLTTINSMTGSGSNSYKHHSGWNTTSKTFADAVKLQNAATAPSTRWNWPKHGLVRGPGRLEPAAVGGVHGKGFWMDGTIGLEFAIPTQPAGVNVGSFDWYVGLFVDCRHEDDAVERRLMTFPDNSTISLSGRRQIVYAKNGVVIQRITLPAVLASAPATHWDDLLPDTRWAHLAFQIRKAGTEVDFHLNGLVYHRWQDAYTSLFQLPVGNLSLGRPNGATTVTGFTGWADDFKVFAHAVDLETACNHANGTLIGLPSAYTGDWKTKFADRYPSWTHDEITKWLKANGEATHPKYACFYNHQQDNAAHLFNIPAGTVSLRQSVHFPEGPLYHNKPRPHSVQNAFCISCHKPTANGVGLAGLDLEAISWDTTFNADQDPRRQPLQPPRRIYGYIPAGLIDTTGLPSTATALSATGQLIDQWMLPSLSVAPVVQSYTVVDATTGRDLMDLPNNGVIDPAKLGSTNLTIRANLNTAQGAVAMQYDTGTVNNRPVPPYAVFGNGTNPLAGQTLTVGAHSVKATPAGGTLNTVNFTVVGNTARVVADYRDDYKTHSPVPGWSYQWNKFGPITNPANFAYLNNRVGANNYTSNGNATFPEPLTDGAYIQLTSTGGHPGRGTAQGQTTDRFAIAAYTVKLAGYYGVSNGFVKGSSTGGNGGQVIVYKETNNGTTFTQIFTGTYVAGAQLDITSLNTGLLQKGDTIYVCAGPNTTDGSDSFTIDFSIWCRENANPF